MKRSIPPRWIVVAAAACGFVVLCWFVPPFRVVPLKASRQQATAAAFSGPAFVEKFWNERLMKSADRAANAAALLAEIRTNPKAAREKHGRSAGLGTTYYYFLTGEGRVVAVDPRGISLSLDPAAGAAARPDVVIETGNVFGNAVRDGTGLLNVNDFKNSRDYNDVSSEINRRIETDVIPPLRTKATVGSTVQFVGCAEVVNEATDLAPLRVIPVSAVMR